MRHPYSDFLHSVQRPARYVGGEHGQVVKDPAAVRVSLVLAFPDVYDIGMSHLGTKILYKIVNAREGLAAERCFCPWADMEAELRARSLPLLSLESARPLRDFDVVGFSLQYELTYTNVLNMLDLSDIPLRSAARGEGDPLVIAGGPTATHPEPLAPFIDAFVIGDAEQKLPELLDAWGALRDQGVPRAERLLALARLGGIYVPSLYETAEDALTGLHVVQAPATDAPFPIVKAMIDSLDDYPFPDDSPEPVAEAIFDRMSIEIARGCTEGCRFCQAGMIYRPVRERSPEAIVDTIVSAIQKGGYDEASLTSLSTADYSCISPLIKKVLARLEEEGQPISLSVSSLRAYGLGEDTLDDLAATKTGGLTFAPEAGTQRMRDVVNKNVSEEDILESAHRVFSKGWQKMKLYFMIGLPGELDEDVLGIVETANRVQNVGWRYHGRGTVRVTASTSSHVPKPHTPFQWCAMDTVDDLKRKQRMLAGFGRERKVQVKWHDVRTSWLECIMARGDRRVADVVETAWRKGARFDGWDEVLKFDAWLEAIEEHGLETAPYLSTIRTDGGLPWDHIDVRLEPGFLAREYRRANQNRLSPPCGKPAKSIVHHTNLTEAEADARRLVCYNCGLACDMTAMREERIDSLRRLGAVDPPPPNRPVAEIQAGGRVKKGPPVREPQGDSWRYRITWSKTGVSRLVSHLDLVRTMPRTFRRAGLTMRRSEGYAPKPLLSWGPALPLGTWGMEEALDVWLLQELEPAELLARINAVAPGGIVFADARQLDLKERPVARVLRVGEYLIATDGRHDMDALGERVAGFLAEANVPVMRTRRRGDRTIDMRADVMELEVLPAEALAGLHPEFAHVTAPALRVMLRIGTENSFRPEELLTHLCGENEAAPVVVRTRLFEDTSAPDEGDEVEAAEGETDAAQAETREEAAA